MKRKPVSRFSPSLTYLAQVGARLAAVRRALPALSEMGERMAGHLLAGGNIFTPPLTSWFPSEFCGRSGGLMGVRGAAYRPRNRNDVAFFALPDPRFWKPREDETLRQLLASPARLFVVGSPGEWPQHWRRRVAGFTGGASVEQGAYALANLRPLVSLRSFEQFVRLWIVTGELIAACIRAGRMPILWMSVWLEGAMVRNASFCDQDNLREPWLTPLFHQRRYIPPLAPGDAGRAFLAELAMIHGRLVRQASGLAQAGQWMAQAHHSGAHIHAVAVGHSFPAILELQHIPDYPIQWGKSVSDLRLAVPAAVRRHDVALHLGYAPVDVADVAAILRRGVKFIYTTPYGRPATLADHPGLLWLDLPWRPTDATVDIPGYGVRMLPMSSSAQAMCYHALLAEFAQRMGWH